MVFTSILRKLFKGYLGAPKGPSKSHFHMGFLHKTRQEIAWNSCSHQVYPTTLDARLITQEITQFFPFNSRFNTLKYVDSRHQAFPLGGPFLTNWPEISNEHISIAYTQGIRLSYDI